MEEAKHSTQSRAEKGCSDFGYSDKPQPKYGFDYTLDEFVSALESVNDELGVNKVSLVVQVLRHLAPDISYRSLVALGIASVQGLVVASFQKDDATRMLFFCRRPENNVHMNINIPPTPT
ncbi:hypothetical protein L6452_13111 [Arctium lappa]|uniref:Uncharacterized protein n=1 Tax=Arctium lappa TaxID=4217 RepID=A0ACB9CHP4_ARCLA|nr:hypothetical protein L6452_13111 [Arctium lappa]